MYLRHTTRKKNGKTHVYWQLVRSVRHGRKVVQQTVAQLGELDAQGRARAQALARGITGEAANGSQQRLFDADAAVGAVPVALAQVRLERSRAFGAEWLGSVAGAEARRVMRPIVAGGPRERGLGGHGGHAGDWAVVRALQ